MKWTQLTPDEEFLDALNHAGTRSDVTTQDAKRHWSERFADACAVLIAAQLSAQVPIKKSVKPLDLDAGTEPLTPLGAGASKRIDVTVTDPMLGLEIGVSPERSQFPRCSVFKLR